MGQQAMKRFQVILVAIAGLGLADGIEAADASATPGYKRQIITLTTDDGREVPAVLTIPTDGVNPYMAGFVHHHGGPGGHPISHMGAPRFFAEGAAKAGYANVSVLSNHSRWYPNAKMETAVADIKTAVDFLDDYGIDDVLLTGHSLGAVRIARYMTGSGDLRVKAMIQFAPTRDMPEWMRGGMGRKAYAALIGEAQGWIDRGEPSHRIVTNFEPESPPWPSGIKVAYSHTAETFLDWWGPDANTYNTRLITQIQQPILLLAGDKDSFVYPEYLEELKAAAIESSRVDTILYENVTHTFPENRTQVIADTLAWVDDIGYGPRPAVSTDLVDAETGSGRKMSGVLYAPASGEDLSRPIFLLLHGWSGDVLWSSNHWLGVRLAQAGYSAIAMRVRVSGRRGVTSQTLDTIVEDLGTWSDFASNRGYSSIVGEGHSAGGIWWTTYLNSRDDPTIKGVVYLAPTRNMADALIGWIGQEAYGELVQHANAAVSEGRKLMISSDLLPPDLRDRFPFFQYANAFLSYWGPEAKTVHTDEVNKLQIPVLSIAGSEDGLVPLDYLKQFDAAARDSEYRYYDDGAPHSLQGWEDRTAADIISWVESQGL